MNSLSGLHISFDNYQKISALINQMPTNENEKLQEELDRAVLYASEDIPRDVVTMNSVVVFKDLKTLKMSTVTVVYPEDADIENNKISVLAPIGAALIGLREKQKIEWPLPNGAIRKIVVDSIIYQPESENSHSLSRGLK